MNFIFEQIRTGGDRNFGYLIGDRETRVGALVDPSYDPQKLVARAEAQGLGIEYILNTHGHSDHTNGNQKAKKLTGAAIAAFGGASGSFDLALADGQVLRLGSLALEVIHVPGHTEDHIVIYLEEQKVAITGDHLFVGKIGGTGTEAAARAEFESLKRNLVRFPDDVTIWPGHDHGCRPSSTIALEKMVNPFLQRLRNIDEFLKLKREWAGFKATHGLV
jgi:glyoxylase-like metal-dependent hydrolase (beta-lactamase superfamily II)